MGINEEKPMTIPVTRFLKESANTARFRWGPGIIGFSGPGFNNKYFCFRKRLSLTCHI